jgi:hypothetical protein
VEWVAALFIVSCCVVLCCVVLCVRLGVLGAGQGRGGGRMCVQTGIEAQSSALCCIVSSFVSLCLLSSSQHCVAHNELRILDTRFLYSLFFSHLLTPFLPLLLVFTPFPALSFSLSLISLLLSL